MNKILLPIAFILCSNVLLGQDILDIEKLKNCELFPIKGEFDNSERLKEIETLRGEKITVFVLKRNKKNIIRSSYTGVIDYRLIDRAAEQGSEHPVEVIAVRLEPENGTFKMYLPHTNLKYYRLYRTSCLSQIK